MSSTQVAAVSMTVVISALDGYDVLAASFAAPAISHAWGVGKAALGLVLSSGLFGMALGALVLSPLADLVGRRRLVFLSLALMAVGMLLSALAQSPWQLATWRVLTGVGIGAMVAVITPLAAEFANSRRRPLALALMAMGYPAGGVLGGLLSAYLLEAQGWRAVFWTGFAAALALLPCVYFFLPEPLAFLLAKRGPDGLERVNRLLKRFRQEAVAELPPQTPEVGRAYARIFAPGLRMRTIKLTGVSLTYAMVAYYMLTWLPQMVADAGFASSTASLASAVNGAAGILGGVMLGVLAQRLGLARLTAAAMAGVGLALVAFGFAPAVLPLLLLAAGLCGAFMYAGVAGLYATRGAAYSPEARATGAGFVTGFGRLGSAAAPAVAGALFASGLGRAEVSLAFGALAVFSGALFLWPASARGEVIPLEPRTRRTERA